VYGSGYARDCALLAGRGRRRATPARSRSPFHDGTPIRCPARQLPRTGINGVSSRAGQHRHRTPTETCYRRWHLFQGSRQGDGDSCSDADATPHAAPPAVSASVTGADATHDRTDPRRLPRRTGHATSGPSSRRPATRELDTKEEIVRRRGSGTLNLMPVLLHFTTAWATVAREGHRVEVGEPSREPHLR
jgi:hypothetical protein